MISSRSIVSHACVYVCLSLLVAMPAFGQIGRPDSDPRTGRTGTSQADRAAIAVTSVPLEGVLDETAYIVGPGDVFVVSIGGPEPIVTSIPVSADGRLLLPAVGGVRVAELNLAEARMRIIDTLRPSFMRVRLDVALVQPRQFYVHVSGAVPVPGRYLATPVARLSTVLEMAFADTSRAPVANLDYRPSFRDITLRRAGSPPRSVDLQRYLSTGDTQHNPYLNDGDVIAIGVYDPTRESVFVDGAVPFPGAYAYREGDTVADLVALASGENVTMRGVQEIRITRRAGGVADARVLRVGDGESMNVALSPLDHVFVRADDALRGSATVDGWVRYPGTYPVEPGITTLGELVAMAGGLREGALQRGVHVERRILPEPQFRRSRTNRFDSLPELDPAAARADTVAILRNLRLSELGFMSRAYLSQELRLQNRVSIEPSQLSAGGANPVYVQDGDRLVVPRDEGTVYVFGQVNRPGYVSFREGESASHYLERAGGMSPIASGVYVIEAGSGRHVPIRDAGTVGTGDMIFVDRRTDIADTADMRRLVMDENRMLMEENRMLLEERRMRSESRFRTTQTVLQVVGTAAGVVTTYLVLRARIE
jgi:polysaccharide biosynthesis/export protein